MLNYKKCQIKKYAFQLNKMANNFLFWNEKKMWRGRNIDQFEWSVAQENVRFSRNGQIAPDFS